MPERFTDRLHRLAEPIWKAQHEHPFVRGIGDGTLALDRFDYWVRQDYLFLIDYARLFAIASARAPDLELIIQFIDLAHTTVTREMSLHRAYAERFGISNAELENAIPSPTTLAYVNFFLRTAALSSFSELIATVLPCMWGFCEIGQRLASRKLPTDQRYVDWIKMYSDPEFAKLTDGYRDLLDCLAERASDDERKRMEGAFLTSSRYEYLFWEMAWIKEQWLV